MQRCNSGETRTHIDAETLQRHDIRETDHYKKEETIQLHEEARTETLYEGTVKGDCPHGCQEKDHTLVSFTPSQTGKLEKISLAIEWKDWQNKDGRCRLVLFKNDTQIAERDCFGAA